VPPVAKKENGKRLSKPERRQRKARTALAVLEEFVGARIRAIG
jgi:hypothetical protein